MTLAERATVLSVGAALWIPGVIGIWKAASLRGDLSGKWSTRVDLAFNGLSERLATELLRIQEVITAMVGSADSPFDPLKVVEDPSALREPIERFSALLHVRDRLRPRFDLLLGIGPILLSAIAVYLGGVAVATTYVAQLHHFRGLTIASNYAVAAAIAIIMAAFALYAYLQQRLASAEIRSRSHDAR